MTKGNPDRATVTRAQNRGQASSALDRIRAAARRDRSTRFTSLMHHITPELLEQSYKTLKRQAAPGVDGVTWTKYGRGLSERIAELHRRIHSDQYRAVPSRRVWIPKGSDGQRPVGIAALEDKIVQQAVVRILTPIYETDFLGFSYGFRPGRNQHNALDALCVGIKTRKINWVLDADVKSFFDTVSHSWMEKFLAKRSLSDIASFGESF